MEQRGELLNQILHHDLILELFAGQGSLSHHMYADNCKKLILVDINRDYLVIAEEKIRDRVEYETYCLDNIRWIKTVLRYELKQFQDRLTLVDFDDFGMPGEAIQAFFEIYRVERPLLVAITDGGSHKLGFFSKDVANLLSKHYMMNVDYTRDKQIFFVDQLMENIAKTQKCSIRRINWAQNPQKTVIYAGYSLKPKR